jgi:putative membrane protein
VFAHGGKPHTWHDLWRSWTFEPLVVTALLITAFLFIRGTIRVWKRSGKGHGIRRWEATVFLFGWISLLIALVSPLHAWGRVLFSAHMTQHEVLMLVAAPLLVLSRPLIAFTWAVRAEWSQNIRTLGKTRWLKSLWHFFTLPFVAWLIHAIALWMWHVPRLFDAVLKYESVHTLQHLSFFLSALVFWWALIHGRQGLMGYGAAVLYVFTTSLHSGLLGAFITFSHTLWYAGYSGLTQSWGLTPIEDQQLGGLIMWIPAGLVYIVSGLALFAGWLRESETQVVRRERRIANG